MKSINPRLIVAVAVAIVILIALAVAIDAPAHQREIDVVALAHNVEDGSVAKVEISRDGRSAAVTYVDNSMEPARVSIPSDTSLPDILSQADIPFDSWPPMPVVQQSVASRYSTLARFSVIVILVVGAVWLLRRSSGGFSTGNSRRGAFEPIRAGERPVLFTDVAGSDEIKEEVGDIIEFLREPDKFQRLGARIPRGILLVGPPGTGKTLLARAVAGEARASFFSVSGSEFVEMYVGVGASRVRELFKKARECAPAIVFVDEIDAIGRRRGRAEHSSEYDQTLNQILVEMDGFEQKATVVVLAATNRADILDPALLRPGRFDRKIQVSLPDRASRASILRVHARGKPLGEAVDLDELAGRTSGLSGADLANLLNDAAILAARRGGDQIEAHDLFEAIDRSFAGPARAAGRFSERERRVIAWHEAGHALVAHALPHADPVRKVSIVARGQAGGYTLMVPEGDRGLWTRRQLTDRLAALLGGYAAEQLVFGDVTTGSSNDLEQASAMTLSMVGRYGMGTAFGLFALGQEELSGPAPSQRTAFAAETEARQLVQDAHLLACEVLGKRRAQLDLLAERLLQVETVEHAELVELFGPATVAPADNEGPRAPVRDVPERAPASASRSRRATRLDRLVQAPAAIITSIRLARRTRIPD